MRRHLLLLIVMVALPTALAQYVALDVEQVDEPDLTACYQYVMRSATAEAPDGLMVGLAVDEGTVHSIDIVRTDVHADDLVFNVYGVLEGDSVILAFPERDESVRLPVQYGGAEMEDDLEFEEHAVVGVTPDFLHRLVTEPSELRVRFVSRTNEVELTLEPAFLEQFQPFIETCL